MITIEEAKLDKEKLQTAITELVSQFEAKYGQDTIRTLGIKRWNGSNAAFGPVSHVNVDISLLD